MTELAPRSRWGKYVRDLETLPGDLRLLYRRGGWTEVWPALAARSIFRIVRGGRFLVIAQDTSEIKEVAPPTGVSVRILSEHEWDGLRSLVTTRDLDRFRKLVEDGHTGVVAWRKERPVGYTWYATRIVPGVTALPVPLPPYAAYLWDLYVVPTERGSGIGSALATARMRLAREAGFREAWRIIAPSNHASLRTVVKTEGNGRVVGEIVFLKLFSRVFSRYTEGPSGRPVPA